MMDHEQALQLLPGYLDGELELAAALDFERHLAGCAQCQAALETQGRVSRQLRQADLRADLPEPLRRRLRASLPVRRTPGQKLAGLFDGGRLAFATLAAIAAAAAFLGATIWTLAEPPREQRLAQAVVDSHVRSLQLDHLADVRSTDRHTVKPWFDGKLDFAPPVADFARQGYPLVGGRLDYLDGRPAAVMVYRYQQHPINLYIWPDPGMDAAPRAGSHQGYRYAHWRSDGMAYWAVTDAGPNELDGLVSLLRAPAAP